MLRIDLAGDLLRKLLTLVQENTPRRFISSQPPRLRAARPKRPTVANGEGEGSCRPTEHGGHDEAARARNADTGEAARAGRNCQAPSRAPIA